MLFLWHINSLFFHRATAPLITVTGLAATIIMNTHYEKVTFYNLGHTDNIS